MSGEKLKPKNSESLRGVEVSKEHSEKLRNKLEREASEAEGKEKKGIQETRKTVESQAISGKEIQSKDSEKTSEPQNITKAEKTRTYKSTMKRVQNQLPLPSRSFSKFVHNPAVEKTSEVLSTTVARPSGLLGAGFIGFVLFATVLYFAKRNGFAIPSNSTLFILVLIGGWITGLVLEGIYKLFKKISGR